MIPLPTPSSVPIAKRFIDALQKVNHVYFGSFVLHRYMTDCGMDPKWKPNDVDVAVKIDAECLRDGDGFRKVMETFMTLVPDAPITSVVISPDILDDFPSLMNLIKTEETEKIHDLIDKLADEAILIRVTESMSMNLFDYTDPPRSEADDLDDVIARMHRALANYREMVSLRLEMEEKKKKEKEAPMPVPAPVPKHDRLFELIEFCRIGWGTYMYTSHLVKFVITLDVDGVPHQLVGVSSILQTLGAAGILRTIVDWPANVFGTVRRPDTVFVYDVPDKTVDILSTMSIPKNAIHSSRIAKYEERGFKIT